MGITILFLLLSGVLVIGTVIYLNYKKANTNQNIRNKTIEKVETKQSNKKKTKKQLSDILEISIKDNIIGLGNRYSIVVKLGNIDYNMLSDAEQETIENTLIQTALAIDYPIQFFSTTEYIDTSKIISLIKENKAKNMKIAEYQSYLMEYLSNLMENRTISVIQNYAIISYDGLYETATEELERRSNSLKSNLLRAKIVCSTLNENELYNLIFRELNKNSTINVNLLKGGQNLYVGKKQENKGNKHIS